jgi:hypothetical protein
MKITIKAAILVACVAALGCSARSPAGNPGQPQDLASIVRQLPTQLTLDQAQRLLVTIKPEEVQRGRGLLDVDVILANPAIRYYPYGAYNFPYYTEGLYYKPYTPNCTLPYFYRMKRFYEPFAPDNPLTAPCTTTLDVTKTIPGS